MDKDAEEQPVVQWVHPSMRDPASLYTSQNGDLTTVALAPLSRRLTAYLLDVLLFFCLFVVGYVLWLLLTMFQGQTPGKKLMKIKVNDSKTGETLGWTGMFFREVVIKGILVPTMSLMTFGIPLLADNLIAIREKRNRTAHDFISGTVVVWAD